MRAVLVNYVHPDTPHVSAMRMRHFADCLAARGHRVILLTRTRNHDDPPTFSAENIKSAIEAQDWSTTMLLACKPSSSSTLAAIRDIRTPSLVRRSLIVWHYVLDHGLASDWTDGTRAYWRYIIEDFSPEVIWATFGGTDSWVIARELARQGNIPWVMDVKDTWHFVPAPFRKMLARRFACASAITANSRFLAEQYARWFPRRAQVIYSGVGDGWIQPTTAPVEGFRVMLVGGIYDEVNLANFVRGFRHWLESMTRGERDRVSFCYAGSHTVEVKRAVADLAMLCRIDLMPYVPLTELASLCHGAAVNAYLWNPKTFHHKLVELLCCRRPVISFPGEHAESMELARRVGGSLSVCRDEWELQDTLDEIWRGGAQPAGGVERLGELTWTEQANHLEAVLRSVVEGMWP